MPSKLKLPPAIQPLTDCSVGRWTGGKSIWVGALSGAGYGLLLWLVADLIFLPATNSVLQAAPGWSFALAHLIYGALLGGWVLHTVMHRQASNAL